MLTNPRDAFRGHLRSSEPTCYRSTTYDFLLTFHSNHGRSRTVSEIHLKGDFSRKSQNRPTRTYFAPPLTGLHLELGIGAQSQKTRMMLLPGGRKSFKIGSAI